MSMNKSKADFLHKLKDFQYSPRFHSTVFATLKLILLITFCLLLFCFWHYGRVGILFSMRIEKSPIHPQSFWGRMCCRHPNDATIWAFDSLGGYEALHRSINPRFLPNQVNLITLRHSLGTRWFPRIIRWFESNHPLSMFSSLPNCI